LITSFERYSKKDLYIPLSKLGKESDCCLVDLSVILGSLKNHKSEDDFKKNLSYSLRAGEEFYITSRNFEKFNDGIRFLKNEMNNRKGYKNGRSKHYVSDFDKRFLNTRRKIDLEQNLSDLFYEKKKIIQFKGDSKKDYNSIYFECLNMENDYKGDSTIFDFLVSGLTLSKKYKVTLLSNNFGMVNFLDSFFLKNSSKNYNLNLFARLDEDNFERLV